MTKPTRLLVSFLLAWGALGFGCSVNENVNAKRKCKDGYKGFCIGIEMDGGMSGDDAAVSDSDAASGAGESCTKEDEERPPRSCYSLKSWRIADQAPCKLGKQTCKNGVWSDCEGEVLPQKETCNNEDDDCDGVIDEDTGGTVCAVPEKLGVCADGRTLCIAGEERCVSFNEPSPEVCDGKDLDRDCDGHVASRDPDLFIPCYDTAKDTGCEEDGMGGFTCKGQCQAGVTKCGVDGKRTACLEAVYAEAEEAPTPPAVGEEIPEPVDENCNGFIDENFQCNPELEYACYTGPAGTRGKGTCKGGKRVCNDDGNFEEACLGQILPEPETCANPDEDNDCDGEPGNIPELEQPCASPGITECARNAVMKCNGAVLECTDAPKSPEICDGKDNDCDQQIDQDCGSGRNCCPGNLCVDHQTNNQHCGTCGNSCGAGTTCCSGQCVNTQNDVKHCGSCGNKCNGILLNPDGVCKKGACQLTL